MLMLALAACGAEQGRTGAAPHEGADAGEERAATLTTRDKMLMALPSEAASPALTRAGSQEIIDGQDTRAPGVCQGTTGTNCAGLQFLGGVRFHDRTNLDRELRFNIISFDTAENTQVAMKGLTAEGRTHAGARAQQISAKTGADATEAVAGDEEYVVTLRVGMVIAQVRGINVDRKVVDDSAKMQVERIKKAAAGSNPDA
ncbi:hypothetical protein [Streptomyces anulatus]|uniref:hypothetical protein n=1 Tax=Streptomyces anulatus TaxID=1892 RepID=UPI003F4A357E